MVDIKTELIEVSGHKRIKITLCEGTKVIEADTVNPLNSKERKKVASRLAEDCGEMELVERIEQRLLECISLMDDAADEERDEAASDQAEVVQGDMTLVRAELVISDQVVALTVPEMVRVGGENLGRWKMYARWKDGKREAMVLPERIVCGPQSAVGSEDSKALPATADCRLPTADFFWIHPIPAPPALPVTCLWSAASRQEWLESRREPTARSVFEKLYEVFDTFLEVGTKPITPENALSTNPVTATLALWTMLTYCYPAWEAVPYLYIGGPAGSGKTRVFELLSRLAFRPIVSSNLSAAALFRTLHERGGTLLLDEAERLNEGAPDQAEIRSVLLAGYKRGGRATRLEASGDSYKTNEFQVFGPKALACINAPTGPMMSRCIAIQMFRMEKGNPKGKRKLDANPAIWQELRDDLHCLTLGELGLKACELATWSDVCALGGRNDELWQPILALAKLVDPDLRAAIEEWVLSSIESAQEETVPEEDQLLLRVLTLAMHSGREVNCKMLLNKALIHDSSVLKAFTPKKVSAALKRYGLVLHRRESGRFYPIDLEQMRRIERCYGLDLGACTPQVSGTLSDKY